MATEIEIDAVINTDRSNDGLGQLRRGMRELISLQSQVGQGSAQFNRLQEAINQVEGQIGDLNDSFQTLRGSGVERVNSSLGLFQQGLQNADPTQLRIGLQGLSAAMDAIPIAALIAAVGYLIQNFDKVLEVLRDITGGFTQQERELRKLKAAYESQKIASENLVKQYENELKILEALNKGQTELDTKRRQAESQNAANKQKELDLSKKELEIEAKRTSVYEDFLSTIYAFDAVIENRRERLQSFEDSVKKLQQELDDIQANAAVSEINTTEKTLDKLRDLQNEANTARINNLRESRRQEIELENAANSKGVEALEKRLREDKDNAQYYQSLIASQLETHRINVANINTKYDLIELERRLEADLKFRTSIIDTYAYLEQQRDLNLKRIQKSNDDGFLSNEDYIKNLERLRQEDLTNFEANSDYLLRAGEEYETKRFDLSKKYDDLIKNAKQKAASTIDDIFISTIQRGAADFAKFQEIVTQLNSLQLSKRIEALNKQKNQELDIVQKNKDVVLATGRTEGELRLEIEKKYNQLVLQERIKSAQRYIQAAQQSMAILSSLAQIQTNNELYELNQQRYSKDAAVDNDNNRTEEKLDAEKKYTDNLLKNDSLTSEQRDQITQASENRQSKIEQDSKNKQLALNNDFAKKEVEIKRKQFQREKALQIATGVINTAAAVLQTIASVPYPANIPLALLAGAAGAAQVAVIASQKFDDGGYAANQTINPVSSSLGGSAVNPAPTPTFDPKAIGLPNGQNTPEALGPQKVYVLEGDIRNVIGKVNVFETRASFGN